MGATSVTGVSGPGSVAGIQKGSEHMSLGVGKLVGPKVAAAGAATLSGGTFAVEFPALAGAVTDYIVMLSANANTLPYVSVALAAITDTDEWGFTITGGTSDVVNWAVVKVGNA